MPETNPRRDAFPCWALVHPSEDGSGTWVAHCLDYDVVTFGDSAQQVIADVSELVGEVILDDLGQGLNPGKRRAPQENWNQLARILRAGVRIDGDEALSAYLNGMTKQLAARVQLATLFTIFVEGLVERSAPEDTFNVEKPLPIFAEATAA